MNPVDRALLVAVSTTVVALLAWISLVGSQDAGHAPDPATDEVGGEEEAAEVGGQEEAAAAPVPLPEGPSQELVSRTCTGCHDARVILSQHLPRERWDATLDHMNMQNLEPLEDADRAAILDYLVAHFGGAAAESPAESPWAHPRYEPNPLW